jgi:hypothetical protein
MAGATIKENKTPEIASAIESEYYKKLRGDQAQSRGAQAAFCGATN